MRVQTIIIEGNEKRYILLDNNEDIVMPVAKWLKYLDNLEKSINTLYTYCHAMKNYFEFLNQHGKDYNDVNLHDVSKFIAWLRNPYSSDKVYVLNSKQKPKRASSTIELNITAVTGFYEYLYRTNETNNDLISKLLDKLHGTHGRKYKEFLAHASDRSKLKKRSIKIKKKKRKIRVLDRVTVEKAYNLCTNLRDKFMIRLLFETGFRMSEALSLHISDFVYDHTSGHHINLVDRGDLPERLRLKSGERTVYVSQSLLDLFDDYVYDILQDLDTKGFVFVKLKGENQGQVLETSNIQSIFNRLSKKLNKHIYPHLFRHTHATLYYKTTKNIRALQERLGHQQVQTTIDMYVHLTEDDMRDDWENAQPAFGLDLDCWLGKQNE